MHNVLGVGIECLNIIENKKIELYSSNSNILDVGCSDPSSFFYLYHHKKFETYTGIDIVDKINISIPHNFPIPEELVIQTNTPIYDQYELFHKYHLAQFDQLEKQIFQSTFRFLLSTNISDYLKKTKIKKNST